MKKTQKKNFYKLVMKMKNTLMRKIKRIKKILKKYMNKKIRNLLIKIVYF